MSGGISGLAGLAVGILASALLAGGKLAANEIGDADRGRDVFRACAPCHQVGADATNRVGPQLNGIFGRKAASVDTYVYSKSLARAGSDGLIWDLVRLDAYLENPKALVSGTRMNFRGLKDKQDRDDVLAYLRLFSDDPANIPEAQPTARPAEVDLPPEILALVGDPDYGEYLGSECQTCHQGDGSDAGIPAITGWPDEDFVVAMHAYKQKVRPHPVMQMMAGRLSDEEIAALAAYFGGLE
ncbi:MAG: cytochrome C [Rhodobacteraceae bacterium]|nr:cytochrome C [Paracoccaceae bacterium]